MATSLLAEPTAAPSLFGKVQRGADLLVKAYGIAQAARWARPFAMAGVRAARAFL